MDEGWRQLMHPCCKTIQRSNKIRSDVKQSNWESTRRNGLNQQSGDSSEQETQKKTNNNIKQEVMKGSHEVVSSRESSGGQRRKHGTSVAPSSYLFLCSTKSQNATRWHVKQSKMREENFSSEARISSGFEQLVHQISVGANEPGLFSLLCFYSSFPTRMKKSLLPWRQLLPASWSQPFYTLQPFLGVR